MRTCRNAQQLMAIHFVLAYIEAKSIHEQTNTLDRFAS